MDHWRYRGRLVIVNRNLSFLVCLMSTSMKWKVRVEFFRLCCVQKENSAKLKVELRSAVLGVFLRRIAPPPLPSKERQLFSKGAFTLLRHHSKRIWFCTVAKMTTRNVSTTLNGRPLPSCPTSHKSANSGNSIKN